MHEQVNRIVKKCLLIVFCLAGFVPHAIADLDARQCRYVSLADSEISPAVKEFLEGNPKEIIRQCELDQEFFYYGLSDIDRHGDLCLYLLHELRISEDNKSLGRVGIPQKYMYVTRGECPPRGHFVYVAANNVSEPVFAELTNLFKNFTNSPAQFDLAFEDVSSDADVVDEVKRLKMALFGAKEKPIPTSVMQLNTLWFWERYLVVLNDPQRVAEFYAVSVDRWFWSFYRLEQLGRGIY